eukprot:SAG11_NODE_17485_length_517_cov_0.971292_1_plen_95_part_00
MRLGSKKRRHSLQAHLPMPVGFRSRTPGPSPSVRAESLPPRVPPIADIMGFTSGLMYFGYMFLASYAFAVGTGTIGFLASFVFVRKIYDSIKVD